MDTLDNEIKSAKLSIVNCSVTDISYNVLLKENNKLSSKLEAYYQNNNDGLLPQSQPNGSISLFFITLIYLLLFAIITLFYNNEKIQ